MSQREASTWKTTSASFSSGLQYVTSSRKWCLYHLTWVYFYHIKLILPSSLLQRSGRISTTSHANPMCLVAKGSRGVHHPSKHRRLLHMHVLFEPHPSLAHVSIIHIQLCWGPQTRRVSLFLFVHKMFIETGTWTLAALFFKQIFRQWQKISLEDVPDPTETHTI